MFCFFRTFAPIFLLLCRFYDGRRKNISCPMAQGTLATPLSNSSCFKSFQFCGKRRKYTFPAHVFKIVFVLQVDTNTKTSTPLRCKPPPTTPKSLKRKYLKRRSKLIPSQSTPTKENEKPSNTSSTSHIQPDEVSEDQNSIVKNNELDSLDSCTEYLMTFKSRTKQSLQEKNGFKKNLNNLNSIPASENKTLTTAKNSCLTKGNYTSKLSVSKPKTDISFSDEILSQLADDSWTVKCTAGVYPQMQNEISLDKSLLTQIFMDDDSWTEKCTDVTKPPTNNVPSKPAVAKNSDFVPKSTSTSSESLLRLTVSVSSNKSARTDAEELDKTLPVTPTINSSVFNSRSFGTLTNSNTDNNNLPKPRVPSMTNLQAGISNFQNSLIQRSKCQSISTTTSAQSTSATKNIPMPNVHNSRAKFTHNVSTRNFPVTCATCTSSSVKPCVSNASFAAVNNRSRLSASVPVHFQTIHQCSAAEIEQKRLQALQRKRQRTQL